MKCKKIISLLLALVIAFGSGGAAFAADTDLLINGTEYIYYGELTEGDTLVWSRDGDYVENLYVYYTFNAPADGYYSFVCGTPHTGMDARVCDPDSDIEVPDCESTYYDWFLHRKLYYLNAGEYNLVIDVYSSAEDVEIDFSCLGEEITGITFDYDQLLDSDFDWYQNMYGEYVFDSTADATIEFSSGKTFEYIGGTLYGTIDSEYHDGINNIKIEFFDFYVPSTATVYPVSHYISDIEISNLEYYMENSIEYYNYCDGLEPNGETVTVTFADGSTQQFTWDSGNSVEFPNGQYYRIDIDYDKTYSLGGNECSMQICIDYATLKEYQVSCKKASLSENLKMLSKDMGYQFDGAKELVKYSFEILDITDLKNTAEDSFNVFLEAIWTVFIAQSYISEFILNYLF